MNDTLIDELTKLDLEEKSIKRNLDRNYCVEETRTRLFHKLKMIKKRKERIKFAIKLGKEMKKNEK